VVLNAQALSPNPKTNSPTAHFSDSIFVWALLVAVGPVLEAVSLML